MTTDTVLRIYGLSWQAQGVSERSTEPDEGSKLWAHSINFPEKGCLLIAHPLMFTTQQQYFAQVMSSPSHSPVTLRKKIVQLWSVVTRLPLDGHPYTSRRTGFAAKCTNSPSLLD